MSAERFRLVILGSGKVGKTSVIQRYLYNNFSEKYKETVEDMYSREFRIHGSLLPLDILDTNFYYPDMKKLSIASANAFLLVFSVENVVSFKDVTEAMDELCRLRSDVEKLPVVVAGNKCDLPGKKVQLFLNIFDPNHEQLATFLDFSGNSLCLDQQTSVQIRYSLF